MNKLMKEGTLAALLMSLALPAFAGSSVLASDSPARVPGQYIVVFKDLPNMNAAIVHSRTKDVLAPYPKAQVLREYSYAVHGFAARMSEQAATALTQNPSVAYVEADQRAHIFSTQYSAPWGLDRIDERTDSLDNQYYYTTIASSVDVYIIDTGLTYHNDFGSRIGNGVDEVGDGYGNSNGIQSCPNRSLSDHSGHGTHVGGIAGGQTYGVAKGVELHSVRVLDCNGIGLYSEIVDGVDWVYSHHSSTSVANMSLGGPFSQSLSDAVTSAVNVGVVFVVSAGNSNDNACNYSPASTPKAITVAATDRNDDRANFSNYGGCVDIFAPGVDIKSDWDTSTSATNTISGTSMASPHVAGVAALYLATHSGAAPSTVANYLSAWSTHGVVNNETGAPDKLAYALKIPDAPRVSTEQVSCTPFPQSRISWYQWGETGNSAPSFVAQVQSDYSSYWSTVYSGTRTSATFSPSPGFQRYTVRVRTTIDGKTGPWRYGFLVSNCSIK